MSFEGKVSSNRVVFGRDLNYQISTWLVPMQSGRLIKLVFTYIYIYIEINECSTLAKYLKFVIELLGQSGVTQ